MAEVLYVTIDAHCDPYDRITHLGGHGWRKTRAELVSCIEQGTDDYYITHYGVPARLLVATSRFGSKYVKSELEGEEPHFLLSLPQQAT